MSAVRNKRGVESLCGLDGYFEFVVGGLTYHLESSTMEKYPDSHLVELLTLKQDGKKNRPVHIDRNGTIFPYVFDFLRYGRLPRDEKGNMLIDATTRSAVRTEAVFFNLPALVGQCDEAEAQTGFMCYWTIYKNVCDGIKHGQWGEEEEEETSSWVVPKEISSLKKEEEGEDEEQDEEDTKQYTELLSQIRVPFCITGSIACDDSGNDRAIYKGSTINKPNLPELLADAVLSPFGKGFETVVDTQVRHSYEISVTKEDIYFRDEERIAALAPTARLELRPYKLVIYQEGGHFEEHRDTVRGAGHIGTLVLILNSEYTGGELEVSHGDRTEVVTGPYQWVAMYGDCLHKINPVTSGTRVSLIFDIYQTQKNDDVWQPRYSWDEPDVPGIPVHGVNEAQQQALVAGTREQLQGFDAVAVCLQHLYPACQANPSFLKGADQLLYTHLQAHFDLSVVPCTIYRKRYDDYYNRNADNECIVAPYVDANFTPAEAAQARAVAQLKTKLIVVEALSRNHVIKHEQLNYTGNEGQGEELMYIVAVLLARPKAVPVPVPVV